MYLFGKYLLRFVSVQITFNPLCNETSHRGFYILKENPPNFLILLKSAAEYVIIGTNNIKRSIRNEKTVT